MIPKCVAYCIIYLLLFSFTATAQPALPDITATVSRGAIIVSWNCQFNAVKSITVLRAPDSVYNYQTIGSFKNPEKGYQEFIDTHPAEGYNCYKLSLVFKSGVLWSSNHFCINYTPAVQPPPAIKENEPAPQIIPAPQPEVKNPVLESNRTYQAERPVVRQKSEFHPAPQQIRQDTFRPVMPPRNITIPFNESAETVTLPIKSKYVYTDPATGHIHMFLPDDVATHFYSVKFYDMEKRMIMEVPRIKESKIILDKRNFQKKGVYKFVLRKDILEFENGHIQVN